MTLDRSWIQLNHKDNKQVVVVHSYIDGFGKPFTTSKAIGDYVNKDIALREMVNTLDGQAVNIYEKYDGIKL